MPTATFAGQPIFGDMTRFTALPFVGSASQADAWLGNPAGTTTVGPCERGPALAITGYLIGPDTPTVQAAITALQAWAEQNGAPAFVPTSTAPGGWDTWPGSWFGPTDLVLQGVIGTNSLGGYQQEYRLILRCSGGPND